MSPEEARNLFYESYSEGHLRRILEWNKPFVQRELELESWSKVIEAVRREVDAEWAVRLIDKCKPEKD